MNSQLAINSRNTFHFSSIGGFYQLPVDPFIKGSRSEIKLIFRPQSRVLNLSGHTFEASISREQMAGAVESASLTVNPPGGDEPNDLITMVVEPSAIANLSPGTYHLQVKDLSSGPEMLLTADVVIAEGN